MINLHDKKTGEFVLPQLGNFSNAHHSRGIFIKFV